MVGRDSNLSDRVFRFHGSEREIPVYSGGRLSLGFVEVGCKSHSKIGQLMGDKELLLKYWADNYLEEVGFMPDVYRFVAHYSPGEMFLPRSRKFGIDANLRYNHVPLEFLENISDSERERLFKSVRRSRKSTHLLEEIMDNQDFMALHALIVDHGDLVHLANLRGTIAESLVQHDIENQAPEGLDFHRNGFLRCFNRYYDSGTEIDGIMIFYNSDNLVELVRRLRRLPHIDVMDKWHDTKSQ